MENPIIDTLLSKCFLEKFRNQLPGQKKKTNITLPDEILCLIASFCGEGTDRNGFVIYKLKLSVYDNLQRKLEKIPKPKFFIDKKAGYVSSINGIVGLVYTHKYICHVTLPIGYESCTTKKDIRITLEIYMNGNRKIRTKQFAENVFYKEYDYYSRYSDWPDQSEWRIFKVVNVANVF